MWEDCSVWGKLVQVGSCLPYVCLSYLCLSPIAMSVSPRSWLFPYAGLKYVSLIVLLSMTLSKVNVASSANHHTLYNG